MPDQTEHQMLDSITAEQIDAYWRAGGLTHGQHSVLMTKKAHRVIFKMLEDKGYLKATLEETVKHASEGWEKMKAGLRGRSETAGVPAQGASVGEVMWGQLQILTSVFSAAGVVSGHEAEKLMLAAGAPPGLVRAMNHIIDVGGAVGVVGGAAKGFVKAAGERITEDMAKKVPQAVQALPKEAEQAINEGLKAEGVPEDKWLGPNPISTVTRKAKVKGGEEFKLPQSLAGAKPQFRVGAKAYTPQFESDLDKALYILAQSTPSKADARYMKSVQDWFTAHGQTYSEAEIRGLGTDVRKNVRAAASKAEPGDVSIPAIARATPRESPLDIARGERGSIRFGPLEDDISKEAKGVTEEEAAKFVKNMESQ